MDDVKIQGMVSNVIKIQFSTMYGTITERERYTLHPGEWFTLGLHMP